MDYSSMTCLMLKNTLRARGLKVGGTKPILIDRLIADDTAHALPPVIDPVIDPIAVPMAMPMPMAMHMPMTALRAAGAAEESRVLIQCGEDLTDLPITNMDTLCDLEQKIYYELGPVLVGRNLMVDENIISRYYGAYVLCELGIGPGTIVSIVDS